MSNLALQEAFIDPRVKARLFATVRAQAGARSSVEDHQASLAEQAGLIPNFGVFRQLCLEDLAEAYHDDREFHARSQKNRRRVWLNLFKPFARLNRILEQLTIRAIDRGGHYVCELVEPRAPDRWEQWFRLGRKLGVREAELMRLYDGAGNGALQTQGIPSDAAARPN